MKIMDKMKDEDLGIALLYNFTLGYEQPVPMDVYDLVLPFLYNDAIRDSLLNYETIEHMLLEQQINNHDFNGQMIKGVKDYRDMTTRSLGIALLQKVLAFDFVENVMCGRALESSILQLNEAKHLGKLLKGKTFNQVYQLFLSLKKKIVILQSSSVGEDIDLSFFHSLGDVVMYETTEQDQIIDYIKDAHIVVTNKNKLGQKELSECYQLELICLFATGVNNIDLDYCEERGIGVCNVKGYSTDTVAQHTFALALSLIDQIQKYDQFIKAKEYVNCGSFSYFDYTFHDVSSMTWGIVGMGDIGKKVAEIARAFGANVQYFSTSGLNQVGDYKRVDFDELLATSDMISIHAPLYDKTQYLFNAEAFSKMKKNAMIINVGRGGIIDEQALVDALNQQLISGAGLDVFEHEPLLETDPIYSLQNMDQVVLTPHVAWGSQEARQRCVEEVYKNIEAHLKGAKRNRVV